MKKDQQTAPSSQRPSVDFANLIRESLPANPVHSPLVRSAEEYFKLLAKPLTAFER